ncbi:MAG TPA: hypothetical protein VLA10_04350 [Ilumatobacter sp.]|nr:hypothetical protein [Ilumatobacter sp.]
MLLRVFVIVATLSIVGPAGGLSAAESAPTAIAALVTSGDTSPPLDTINEFYPDDRSLGDCLSSLPKPGCGSEARGGWHQSLVFVAILAGLAFIAWRVVVQSRKARR